MTQEALKLALEALALASAICDAVPNRESGHLGTLVNAQPDGSHGYRQIQEAEAALVKYLETPTVTPPLPAQEPRNVRERWNVELDGNDLLVCFNDHEKGNKCQYERYSPQRTWVGLTDEEIGDEYVRFEVSKGGFNRFEYAVKAIEAKLKEKNA